MHPFISYQYSADGRTVRTCSLRVFALFALFNLILSAHCANAQSAPTLLVDIDHRSATSLDGDWHVIVDPYFRGEFASRRTLRKDGFWMNETSSPPDGRPLEYSFASSPTLKVPGDWNTQRDTLFYYEGPIWYQRNFKYSAKHGSRTFMHFGAANYKTSVWLNTQKVCEHEGGFTPFDCEVTGFLKTGDNFAVIAVDNSRHTDDVPTSETDWWNYGGITRDVSLVDVPTQFIDDYDLHLSRADHTLIEGYVHVEGAAPGTAVSVAISELQIKRQFVIGPGSRAPISIAAKALSLWSPENPKLYKVEIDADVDHLDDDMGFRTIETRGTEILLNGKPLFLRGVDIHAEAPYRTGRAYSDKDVSTLVGWAKELGCNYVRLAHYPHDQRMTRATDRAGILVWSEIPVYWSILWDRPDVFAKAEQQLDEMIRRDRNKASIALWSVANETPISDARTKFLSKLIDRAHELDPTRPVTAALLVRTETTSNGIRKVVDDPLGQYLDVIGTNEYVGWYEQTPQGADTTTWDIAYQKPVIMSELGAGAKAGMHGPATERWTEEYQAEVYRHQFVMLNRIPQLRGMSPWALMDFRSPVRLLNGIQDGFNRKGLISDQGQKKEAFFVLQKAYHDQTVGKPE